MVTNQPRLKSREGKTMSVDTGEAVEGDHRPWWLPLRSAFGLALLLVCLGVAVAAVLGLIALGVAALFDQALG